MPSKTPLWMVCAVIVRGFDLAEGWLPAAPPEALD